MNNQSRVVVIVGGASGIGFGTAKIFASAGDTVVIADANKEQGIAKAAELRKAGWRSEYRFVDVAIDATVEALVESVESEIGAAQVLVNSAGILQNACEISTTPVQEHDRVMTINYRGTYLCCRAFAPRMAARKSGSIVNISSTSAVHAMPTLAYGPSKAAVQMLTMNLGVELGPDNVRVNAIMPGYVLTETVQARIDAGQRDPRSLQLHSALGRMVMPQDVGNAAFFLSSEAASCITGTTLTVDAGYLPAVSYLHHPALRGVHPRRADQEPVF